MIYYLDTSALVKVYHPEEGSECVRTLYDSPVDQRVISNLSLPETFSSFHRKRVEGVLSDPEFQAVVGKYFSDIAQKRYLVTPLNDHHIQLSLGIIKRRGLKTLDALHLASVLALHPLEVTFVCADASLNLAAVQEGVACLNPCEPRH